MVRVLIIGGGIAGIAAALALDRAGARVSVHEAHPDSGDDIGAFLTLAGNGMLALAQFGADEEVARFGFPLTAMRLTDGGGAVIATTPLGRPEEPLSRYRCLRRAELRHALHTVALRRGIEVRQGARLETAAEDADSVTATFTDGEKVEGDLLVGADGLGSVVRPLVDPGSVPRRYAGQSVFYGYAARADPPHVPERIEMIRGSASAFGYAVSPEGRTSWFARLPGEELPVSEITGPPEDLRRRLLPHLRPDATPAADIVAATGEQILVTNAYDLPPGGVWHTRRMLLIGDAAHAASPATGQGASMALEDAVILAKAVRDTDGMTAALAAYDRLRRARVEDNIERSAGLTRGRAPTGRSAQRDRSAAHQGDRELGRHLAWDERLPPPDRPRSETPG